MKSHSQMIDSHLRFHTQPITHSDEDGNESPAMLGFIDRLHDAYDDGTRASTNLINGMLIDGSTLSVEVPHIWVLGLNPGLLRQFYELMLTAWQQG